MQITDAMVTALFRSDANGDSIRANLIDFSLKKFENTHHIGPLHGFCSSPPKLIPAKTYAAGIR